MTITPERLAAYADGELDAAERELVEAELERSPELRAQVDAHRVLKARLAAHFAPIAEQPVPEQLIDAVRRQSGGAEVIPIKSRAAQRRSAFSLPRWSWVAAPALAASVALAVLAPGARQDADYASGDLALALDRQLAAAEPQAGAVRIVLSFKSTDERYCRAFMATSTAGIACREENGWRVERRFAADARQTTAYRQAGSGPVGLMAAVQDMTAGPALDSSDERRARDQGWRQP